MTNARIFGLQLQRAYQKKVIERLEKTVRAAALVVDSELVKRTPVDTGRARSNWLPSLNVARTDEVAPGERPEVASVFALYKINDTILSTNNLPYIERLNEGHSQQAPAGFVEAAIQVGKNAVRSQ